MRWASHLTVLPELSVAIDGALGAIERDLDGPPDLLMVFVSSSHAERWPLIPSRIHDAFPSATVVGTTGAGVLAGGREAERGPGLALLGARLPGVELHDFALSPAAMENPTPERLRADVGGPADRDPHLLLLGDPFSFPAESVVESLDLAFPDRVKIGGLASAGPRPGANRLFIGRQMTPVGCVGVALRGRIEVDPLVAQGCRPIGPPMFVTAADGTRVLQLDGAPAARALVDVLGALDEQDQKLARTSLFMGVVTSPDQQSYEPGDFLIRNLVGMEPDSGVLAVAARLDVGSIVQFQLRDGQTAAQELESLLLRRDVKGVGGALLCTCLGRGESLYGAPDHDSSVLRDHLGDVPLGGFFCNGEIGPVRGHTHLHGYTSAIALFREPPTQ